VGRTTLVQTFALTPQLRQRVCEGKPRASDWRTQLEHSTLNRTQNTGLDAQTCGPRYSIIGTNRLFGKDRSRQKAS